MSEHNKLKKLNLGSDNFEDDNYDNDTESTAKFITTPSKNIFSFETENSDLKNKQAKDVSSNFMILRIHTIHMRIVLL